MKIKFVLFLILLNYILTNFSFDYKNILNENIKSDIEFIFDSNYNFYQNLTQLETIKKYFHQYKESELNLHNGAKLNCYTPSKINSLVNKQPNLNNTIKIIPLEYMEMFLRENTKMCYNSNFKEWFYKLCPLKSSVQLLTFKKKDQFGNEYTESWTLGTAQNKTEIDTMAIYKKETEDEQSFNLPGDPLVMTQDRIAKIYNYDLSLLKKYEASLILEYDLDDIKDMPDLKINKIYKLSEYIRENPELKKISIQRKIIKLISKHLLLLDAPFPFPKVDFNVNINLIKEKQSLDLDHSFNLMVYGDMVYCYRCEFLTHYKVGDSIFIKNSKLELSYEDKMYKSARIVNIFDNQLLKVEKPFPKNFGGPVLRQNYFAMSSFNLTRRYTGSSGRINIKERLVFGYMTEFRKQIQTGDKLLFFNANSVKDYHHITSTNPLAYPESNCVVSKILTDNMLLLEEPCDMGIAKQKSFFIMKPFDRFPFMITPVESKTLLSIIDVMTPEFIDISFKSHLFHSKYLFHPGFAIHNNETALSFKLEKIITDKQPAFMRILLGTDEKNYGKEMGQNDLEILIDSESGVLITKLNDNENLEFYDLDVRNLFHENLAVDILIKDNEIFFNSMDDDKESSIKVSFSIPENLKVKYLYLDLFATKNLNIKDILKKNFLEMKYLYNIWIYNKKRMLSEDAYYVEELTGGDYCPEINDSRKTIVEYHCDKSGWNDIVIENVSEISTCVYKYYVRSKNICNPYVLMKNKAIKAVARTKCVVINQNYNSNPTEFFRNIEIESI